MTLSSPLSSSTTPATPTTLVELKSHSPPPDHPSTAALDATPSPKLFNIQPQTPSPTPKLTSRPRKLRRLTFKISASLESPPAPRTRSNSKNLTTTSSSAAAATPPAEITVVDEGNCQLLVVRSLSSHGEIDLALRHLRDADPHLARLIDLHNTPTFKSSQTPFLALVRSILYQQLHTKAASTIYSRFLALCDGEAGVVPHTVLGLTPQQLRQIGVSGRKSSYLHGLASKYQDGVLSDSAIVNMDDETLLTALTQVKGIGSWSVHMFMIFFLHRPDVLPVSDLGVRKGVQLLFGLRELPKPAKMDQLCEKWRPYRSVASWYLWRLVEAKGASS